MKVILAMTPTDHHWPTLSDEETKNDVLISYWYSKLNEPKFRFILGLCKKAGRKLVLDSGVYTARKKGVNIPLSEYLNYCLKFKTDVEYFFNLDLGPHDVQIKNFKALVACQIPTIGIVSNLMTFETIQKFIDIYPYIGISYSVMGQTSGSSDYTQYLERLFEYLYKTNQTHVKTHALGLTKLEVMKRFPFFSCDSSTWINPSRYGAMYVFKQGKLATIPAVKLSRGVRMYGAVAAAQRQEINDHALRIMYSAREFSKMQDWITNLWTHRGVVWN